MTAVAAKKTKAAKQKPIKEIDRLKEADELLGRIEQAEKRCDEALMRLNIAKEEAKERKGDYQSAVLSLRKLCRARDEKHPLFEKPKDAKAENSKVADKKPESNATPATKQPNNEWRSMNVVALGATEKTTAKLIDKGIETLGQLSDLMNKHGQWWPKEIKGIGEAAATEVADAFAAFWSKHPEFAA